MFLHIGKDILVEKKNIIYILDIDNTTVSYVTRQFVEERERKKDIVVVSNSDLPRSFIISKENGKDIVYMSPIAASSLIKRWSGEKIF